MLNNRCGFVGCREIIPPNHFLCFEHYGDWEDELIDQCPVCGRFKDADYKLCLDCYHKRNIPRWRPTSNIPEITRKPKIEHEKAWEKGDTDADRFYVYILKLKDAKYYIGQTRELRERLSEHTDGKTNSTKGLNPKLVYFEVLPNRESAEVRESQLKEINEKNQRQIRRMIIGFKDLVDELNYD